MPEPIQTPEIDLDDTTCCPVTTRCEACATTDDLAVATARTLGGVMCLTLCADCCEGPLPTMAPLTAMTRCGEHCEHLGEGVDLDVMAALVDADGDDR